MKDRTRRLELGKMLLDVAKYLLTIVVIGGLVSEKVGLDAIILGFLFTFGFIGLGFQAIPPEEVDRDQF